MNARQLGASRVATDRRQLDHPARVVAAFPNICARGLPETGGLVMRHRRWQVVARRSNQIPVFVTKVETFSCTMRDPRRTEMGIVVDDRASSAVVKASAVVPLMGVERSAGAVANFGPPIRSIHHGAFAPRVKNVSVRDSNVLERHGVTGSFA